MFSYDNIGEKIKDWAKWVFAVEAIAAVIIGIVLISQDEDLLLVGLLVMVLGPIVAWVSSWILYGYGQLIENSDLIAAEHRRTNERQEKAVAKTIERKQELRRKETKEALANPNVNEDVYVDITCPGCEAVLSYTKGHIQDMVQRNEVLNCPICDTPITF